MANLTRFDPFRDLTAMEPWRNLEDFFSDFSLRPLADKVQTEPRIRMDVTEAQDHYAVKAEIPGMRKEDITVSIDGNQVTLSAEIRQEKEQKKDEKVVRRERFYGRQTRSFSLAHDIDESASSAHYEDGVLNLKLVKKAGTNGSRTLAIQ
ncbi:Hsp20/alpha crystallin family protein [Neopusillimonas maritima]|jgi:HSP20 family protein|uniref:Heat-shock protein Hsp20 n=1 Tax=Neopusillimonas maritima TaxID=2026239 RepID=A0A3A1YZ01_9BURK|nr:Hsp20/alpha crystallin family protein [Neopusillimonas maritima]MAL00610.1 heat-shock protein Hsp20 [Alcaligenaceae bacterium]RII82218.1 heat-shock protein Hsp20 [Neopusillimonas maritima]RIY41714.1 heat-shock protein Hsp20 [Neopusillimonas maritima]